jgi:hypothetical protein
MNAVLHVLELLALFFTAVFVVGAAAAPGGELRPLVRLAIGVTLAIGGWFAGGFVGFALGASNAVTAMLLAVPAVAAVVLRRRAALTLAREPEVRTFLAAWAVFAAWSLGLLALVVTYSGGGWVADWFEHWQRTLFFVERQPLETRFAAIYSLTARPPLANLVIALLLAPVGATFPHFQVGMTLAGTLVLLPAWIAATRWGGARAAGWWVVLLLMLNPLIAQNVTFSWTKLPTAFFVATAVCLALEGMEVRGERATRAAAAGCLGLAMLTHYSAGPWVIALAIAFVGVHRGDWGRAAFWRQLAALALVFAVIVGLWVGWSWLRFGWSGTLQTNTTAEEWHSQSAVQRLVTPALNLFDTVVPFPLRGEPADGLIEQSSRLGRVRDVAFNVYQVNLLLAFGLGGLWVLSRCGQGARRASPGEGTPPAGDETLRPPASRQRRRFLAIAIPTVIVLGVVVHTPRDEWGLVHICLQPLIVLGLAAAAACLPRLNARDRALWAGLAAIDAVLGIALHFGLESWALAPVVAPGGGRIAFLRALSRSAGANANDKWAFGVQFLADQLHAPRSAVVLWLALCLAAVIFRVRTPRLVSGRPAPS